MRLDPTPVALSPGINRKSLSFRLKVMFDTFNYYWDRFVISYDLREQVSLLRRIRSGIKRPSLELAALRQGLADLVWYVPVLLLLFIAGVLVVFLRRKPEEMLLKNFIRRMARKGYRKRPSEGVEEFVQRVSEPDLRARAIKFVSGFQDIFYRDRVFSPEQIKHLRSCIRKL